MRFASAGRSYEDQVGAFLQPAISGTQSRDMSFGDHRDGIKVKVVQSLARQEFRLTEVTLDTAPIALGNLVLGQGHQEACGRPAFLVRALGELRPYVLDGRQAQLV